MEEEPQLRKALRDANCAALSLVQIQMHIRKHHRVPLNKFDVQFYNNKLHGISHEVCALYDIILEDCDKADKPDHELWRAEILDNVFQALMELMVIKEQLNSVTNQSQQDVSSPAEATVSPPELSIEKFSGDILEERSSEDLVEATVDVIQAGAVQEIQDLEPLVSQEPRKGIHGISIVDRTYNPGQMDAPIEEGISMVDGTYNPSHVGAPTEADVICLMPRDGSIKMRSGGIIPTKTAFGRNVSRPMVEQAPNDRYGFWKQRWKYPYCASDNGTQVLTWQPQTPLQWLEGVIPSVIHNWRLVVGGWGPRLVMNMGGCYEQ